MAFEDVMIAVGGGNLRFRPVEIRWRAATGEGARSFTATLAPRDATEAGLAAFAADVAAMGKKLARGPKVRVLASGDTIINGWIERYNPKLSSTAPQVTIEGRSKSALLIDSSAIHAVGEWRGAEPAKIIGELASRYGVPVTDKTVDSLARPLFRLTLGESVHTAARRLVRVDGQLITAAADGGITIHRGTLGRHAGQFVEGVNLCENAEAIHDWSKRAKSQRVKGQRASGWSRDDLEIDEEATDSTVSRPVEVVVVASEEIDARSAARRARWRRDQAAGEGLKVMLPAVIGWRDDDGRIFEPGYTMWIESETLGVAQEMAIESVEGIQSDASGTTMHMQLVDPRALGAKKKKKGKGRARKGRGNRSAKQWEMPDDD